MLISVAEEGRLRGLPAISDLSEIQLKVSGHPRQSIFISRGKRSAGCGYRAGRPWRPSRGASRRGPLSPEAEPLFTPHSAACFLRPAWTSSANYADNAAALSSHLFRKVIKQVIKQPADVRSNSDNWRSYAATYNCTFRLRLEKYPIWLIYFKTM